MTLGVGGGTNTADLNDSEVNLGKTTNGLWVILFGIFEWGWDIFLESTGSGDQLKRMEKYKKSGISFQYLYGESFLFTKSYFKFSILDIIANFLE